MSNTNSQQRSTGRKLAVAPMLATLLACGGSLGLISDLQAAEPKRYDNLAPAARPAIAASRMAEAVQTDGQVDDEFVAPAVLTESSTLTQAWANYAGQYDGLDRSHYSAELFVSNLVSSHRQLQYINNGDGISFWELNSKPQTVASRHVAGGLSNGRNLFV